MVSIVVPVFNEEQLIPLFHRAVAAAMRQARTDWEIVYVNDGSQDSSLHLLTDLQAEDKHVVVVDLSRNWGQVGAVSAGLQTARGAAVIVMDADFQDPPEVVPQLVDAWRRGAQVVTAVRRSRQERRKILAVLFPLFYRVMSMLSDYPLPLNAGLFGLMDRQAVDSINRLQEGNRYLPGLRAWVGYKNEIVYYDRLDRAGGEGKLTFLSRVKYAMDAITSFSYKPLRLCFLLSAASLCLFIALGISALAVSGTLATFALGTVAAVFLMGSLVLLCLGVLGEYLGRVYDEVRGRPLSIIRKVYRSSSAGTAITRTAEEGSYAEEPRPPFPSRVA